MDKFSILYLEDEPLIALDTTEFLKERDFATVETVYSLAAAETAAAAQRFDIALLDINLNDRQTSTELGRALKSEGTQVIFASGYQSRAGALRDEGFDFLDKPFKLDTLDRLLHDIADRIAAA